MDLRRIRAAEAIAGLAGAVLLASLFLPWFSSDGAELAGWESFGVVDLITAGVAVLGISLPLISAGHEKTDLPIVATTAVCLAAIVEVVLLAYRLFEPVGDGREAGPFVALVAAAALAATTWWAMSLET
jgi:uncharacterized membrane protein